MCDRNDSRYFGKRRMDYSLGIVRVSLSHLLLTSKCREEKKGSQGNGVTRRVNMRRCRTANGKNSELVCMCVRPDEKRLMLKSHCEIL